MTTYTRYLIHPDSGLDASLQGLLDEANQKYLPADSLWNEFDRETHTAALLAAWTFIDAVPSAATDAADMYATAEKSFAEADPVKNPDAPEWALETALMDAWELIDEFTTTTTVVE